MSQLALELIAQEKVAQTGRLDLGNCGLTPKNPLLHRVWQELGALTHLEILILSNEWNEWNSEDVGWKMIESNNKGEKNNLEEHPSSLQELNNLHTYVCNGEWQISQIPQFAAPEKMLHLYLGECQITKLENLDKLINLQILFLYNNKISKLENLDSLTSLEILYVGNNQITKIENLEQLSNLRELWIGSNQIVDIGLMEQFRNLVTLDLSNNQITDVSYLQTLVRLEELIIGNNPIATTQPIAKLFPQLKYLNIGTTPIKNKYSYCLWHFSINEYQCIKKIEALIPTNTQFVVFIGENGDGKTSILQALGLGLHESTDLTHNEKGLPDSKVYTTYQIYKKIVRNVPNQAIREPGYQEKMLSYSKVPYPILSSFISLPHFAAYGAARLSISERKALQNPLLNLMTEKAKLYDISETWLRDLSVNEPQKFESVCKILVSLLPNVSAIRKKEPNKILSDLVFIEKGVAVSLQQLSAGHKSLVLMIGDMMARLSKAQPEILDPRDYAGIVLIDELEAHLHPTWQKHLPQILSTTFPKVQFIVTTHSAITLLGMPANTVVYKVGRTEEAGTTIELMDIDFTNLLPNHILSSPLFGLDILPAANTNTNDIVTTDTYEEEQGHQSIRQRLKELAQKLEQQQADEGGIDEKN